MTKTIRVALVDDHPLVRAGIRSTLTAEQELVLVGEANDGYEARRVCQERQPDVLLLDLSMPGPSPEETVAYLREHCPNLRVLVLTAHDEDVYVRGMVDSGVAGYVLKDEAADAIVRAIHAVMQGDTWFSRPVLEKMARWKRTESAADVDLTNRERQVLRMMAQAYDNAYIASRLDLAEQTVRNYVSRIYIKLGVTSRAEAIVRARKQGLVVD